MGGGSRGWEYVKNGNTCTRYAHAWWARREELAALAFLSFMTLSKHCDLYMGLRHHAAIATFLNTRPQHVATMRSELSDATRHEALHSLVRML